jgi:hypothetical protein
MNKWNIWQKLGLMMFYLFILTIIAILLQHAFNFPDYGLGFGVGWLLMDMYQTLKKK